MAFVGFDAALDAGLLVVGGEVLRRRDDFLAGEATEDLGDDVVLWSFVSGLQLAFILILEQLAVGGGECLAVWMGEETYSVMFSSIITSSSRLNCITRNGYLVCPCRKGGSKPIVINVWSSSGFGSSMNFLI